MKRRTLIAALFAISIFPGLAACAGSQKDASSIQIVEVKRGDLIIGVKADGNLDMPHEVMLRFGTPGTVKKIFVEKGDKVREGTLLAKLDDTSQSQGIRKALNDVQLAQNELYITACSQALGFPRYYPNTSALIRFEQAQKELKAAQRLLTDGNYKDAMVNIRLTQYDLEGSIELVEAPPPYADKRWPYQTVDNTSGDSSTEQTYPTIPKALDFLKKDKDSVATIQGLVEKGNYTDAIKQISASLERMQITYMAVKNAVGQVSRYGISTPDIPTTLEYMKPVSQALAKIQKMLEEGNNDSIEISKLLLMAQHDLETSGDILQSDLIYFENGFNLKAMAQYNLNLKTAQIALQNAKDELKKTEILAPFSGTIIDINVKEDDQLSANNYASVTAVQLVDTGKVELEGVVDEIDIFKVRVGQETIVTVDSLPNVEFKGKVSFISPVAKQGTAVVEFPLNVALDRTDKELKGGLTATANLIIEKRQNVLVLPLRAIKGSAGNYRVDVLIDAKTNASESRPVTIGLQNEQSVEILSGLKEGEKVIVGTPAATSK